MVSRLMPLIYALRAKAFYDVPVYKRESGDLRGIDHRPALSSNAHNLHAPESIGSGLA
jgi:hypothetical protein